MQELIWFSVPGAIVLLPYLLGRGAPSQDGQALILIGAAPILGFIVHQAARTVFEALGGYASPHRGVVARIKTNNPPLDALNAFVIWETVFYGDEKEVSESFRAHNRGAWHFVMSFLGAGWAAVIAAIELTIWSEAAAVDPLWRWAMLALALMFLAKARLTGRSISHQEVTFYELHRAAFDDAAKRLIASSSK